ncbi:uncharacterized protein EV420DRAFT_1537499 [Desarmillaria tabescens]|uniref:C3H1-type domain-containing protein n=1 Tax=Armillaria tabescens TaxID=1929756 RepID=A0AA39KFD4_ARMTA|nr:uncharacterized protein EV420DRAFT_1537499 [Desarmillaria tabescens]KAK0459743.1 hypothetical protein EV420DRAFT_1537499 [Desarmillaria tabescens]
MLSMDRIRCSYFARDGTALGPCPYGSSCKYIHPDDDDWGTARSFYGTGPQPSPPKRPRLPATVTTLREAELLAKFHYIDLDRSSPWPTDREALRYRPPVPSSEDAYLQHISTLFVQGIRRQLAIQECATRRQEIRQVSEAFPNGNQTSGISELERYKDLDSLESKLGHLMAETLGDLGELPEPATLQTMETYVEGLYAWMKDSRDRVEYAVKYLKENGHKIWIRERKVKDVSPQVMDNFKIFLQTRIARIEGQIIRGNAELVKHKVVEVERMSDCGDEEYGALMAAMKELKTAHPMWDLQAAGETVLRSKLQPVLDKFENVAMARLEDKLAAVFGQSFLHQYGLGNGATSVKKM